MSPENNKVTQFAITISVTTCDDLTNTDHREALRHRFYPFAPEVSPHELEQMLLLYAFQADNPDQLGETFLLVNDADEVDIIHIL